jgi:hypothetical protein
MTETDFNAAYWLHQPPEVRVLEVNTTPDQDKRMAIGVPLALKGFKIDVPIMLWGWSPLKVMQLRQDFGYTWVPNAMQPQVTASPGLTGPGITPYDPNNPPGGSIKVSTNIADYPPFDPPIVVPSGPATASYVGGQMLLGQNMYYVLLGDHTPPGQPVNDPRGTFIKKLVETPFGFNAYYEKQ